MISGMTYYDVSNIKIKINVMVMAPGTNNPKVKGGFTQLFVLKIVVRLG